MSEIAFNSIGIDGQCDWKRIKKLMIIGLFASILVFVSDWVLGFDEGMDGLSGLESYFSIYKGKSDFTYFFSSLLGMIGIFLEGLSYFSIYRLIAERSPSHAHALRTGIFGYIAFGPCGVHVPCLMVAWLYNYLSISMPDIAYECCFTFVKYFLFPGVIVFAIFFIILLVAQISAFAKGLTPYPKWCWIFNVGFGMVIAILISSVLRGSAIGNAIETSWISIGNIWQYVGLLFLMKKATREI